ncbi:hypothetical protein ACFY6U_43070 [Streptomyces sp. NPDC013157]|uniref:hypothetical protein n=1 Tax=Streptomyces sp. NPDC013157 TaxID=3364861 RepID=UPI00369C3BDB
MPDLRTGRTHRLDLPGALLSTAALTCVTFALMEGDRYSWNAGILALGAAGLALAALFLRQQARRQGAEPLVPFRLFADRGFTVMTALVGAIGAALIAAVLPFGLHFQQQLGFSACTPGSPWRPPRWSPSSSPRSPDASATGSAAAGCCSPDWCPSARGCPR